MNYYRNNAISAGVLFIVATVVGLLSLPLLGPMKTTNYLVDVSTNASQIATAALLLFIGGAAAIGIAISLYPVLKKYNEGLALGAVGFRTVEGVLDFVAVIFLLLLITLSQQFVKAGAPDSSYFQTLGVLLYKGYRWVGSVGMLLAFAIGHLLYNIIFYRTKLVPRWISVWGLVCGILTTLSCVLAMVGLIPVFGTEQLVLALPIAPQEMVLAVWLIVKGFNPSVIASKSSQLDS